MPETQTEIPVPPQAIELALQQCGFELLAKGVWHRPGGIAAKITRNGQARLSMVSTVGIEFSLEAGPFAAPDVCRACNALQATVQLINNPQP